MAEKSHSTFTICNSLCKQIGPIKKGFPATKKEVWESSSNTKSRQFPLQICAKDLGFESVDMYPTRRKNRDSIQPENI